MYSQINQIRKSFEKQRPDIEDYEEPIVVTKDATYLNIAENRQKSTKSPNVPNIDASEQYSKMAKIESGQAK